MGRLTHLPPPFWGVGPKWMHAGMQPGADTAFFIANNVGLNAIGNVSELWLRTSAQDHKIAKALGQESP